jgi:hypothetical protein
MTKKTGNVPSTSGRSANISSGRLALEALMERDPTPRTVSSMAKEIGLPHQTARNTMMSMTMAGRWVAAGREKNFVMYQHVKFSRAREARQDPINNGTMPTAPASWWKDNAPWLQAPARIGA